MNLWGKCSPHRGWDHGNRKGTAWAAHSSSPLGLLAVLFLQPQLNTATLGPLAKGSWDSAGFWTQT